MDFAERLPLLLLAAWLAPLVSFVLVVFFGKRMGKAGVGGAYVATAAIAISCGLSLIALFGWINNHGMPAPLVHHEHHDDGHGSEGHGEAHPAVDSHAHEGDAAPGEQHAAELEHKEEVATAGFEDAGYHGDWYTLAEFGSLKLTIGYYIDALTVVMFCMVTIIATCIHFYAMGYMHDELHDVKDKEVELSTGEHLLRPGRYYRFFQYLSLFCFSMLGIVISGNLAMTFVFWELVGICSYFLIGFYIERKSASTAANKAFIVNRVGDFGFIIGLMIVFSTIGTFNFGGENGIFASVRPGEAHQLTVPDSMVQASAVMHGEVAATDELSAEQLEGFREQGFGYGLLVAVGLGVFCGCVGKSAQFPLHTWLPDAMEGPTPVSALVHSATMVAAGVFLVGRFYPVFTPEVLLTIAVIGCFTLFMAATIAITATDIKRVLAYSTLSQLGYMMFALGVGGWLAGMLHLITHAFFKSLLFMCSGSVIHAVHSNEMTEMGGLRKKMPITAYTMLVGCLAIMGAGIPFLVGFSGYYSKDSIIAQALSFRQANPGWGVMYFFAVGGAAITAFYMFRLWYMTFAGEPRNHHRYDHAHESPRVMWVPLVVLAIFATFAVFPSFEHSGLVRMLSHAEPQGIHTGHAGRLADVTIPPEADSHAHDIHVEATMTAFTTAILGFLLATIMYGLRKINPDEVRQKFSPIYRFLRRKWYFDELYHFAFVIPIKLIGNGAAWFDRTVLDGIIHLLAKLALGVSRIDDFLDRRFVDGFVNWFARATYGTGSWLRGVQTGSIRQYVVYIVVGTVLLFILASFFLNYSLALGTN